MVRSTGINNPNSVWNRNEYINGRQTNGKITIEGIDQGMCC